MVNAMLEETVKKQAQQILQLKRQPNGSLSEQSDPLLTHAQQYTIKATDVSLFSFCFINLYKQNSQLDLYRPVMTMMKRTGKMMNYFRDYIE